MTDKIKRGNEGEQYAADFLAKKGFEIVERNYRYRHSEIDLIVKKSNWLIFVEVKTRNSYSFGIPKNLLTIKKCKRSWKARHTTSKRLTGREMSGTMWCRSCGRGA